MRKRIMVVFLVIILAAFNYSIYEKEQLKKEGEIVLLELAPVDPRSLMQGDYMRLRYAIEDTTKNNIYQEKQEGQEKTAKKGQLVITVDSKNIAQFVRIHQNERLANNERLLAYQLNDYNRIIIRPNSFLFQEGHAKYYENAKYGVFKFNQKNDKLLLGLADENGKLIVVGSPSIVKEVYF